MTVVFIFLGIICVMIAFAIIGLILKVFGAIFGCLFKLMADGCLGIFIIMLIIAFIIGLI